MIKEIWVNYYYIDVYQDTRYIYAAVLHVVNISIEVITVTSASHWKHRTMAVGDRRLPVNCSVQTIAGNMRCCE